MTGKKNPDQLGLKYLLILIRWIYKFFFLLMQFNQSDGTRYTTAKRIINTIMHKNIFVIAHLKIKLPE